VQPHDYGTSLLVIVGAGASAGCLPEQMGARPPLTKDLATRAPLSNRLAVRYEQVQPLLDELRERPTVEGPETARAATVTLEEALRQYLERRTYDDNIARHVAAMRFYLRDLIWESTGAALEADGGMTAYTRLVRRCYDWAARNNSHVCFVNFNYDPMLEIACAPHGLDRTTEAGYTSNPRLSVLKPHGSVLWAWRHPLVSPATGWNGDDAVRESIRAGEPTQQPSGEIAMRLQPPAFISEPGQSWVPLPALALPVTGKGAFVWPPRHEAFFRAFHGRFGRVLTIGWQGAEEHFIPLLQPVVANGAQVLVVTGGNDAEQAEEDGHVVIANLGELAGRTRGGIFAGGFMNLGVEELEPILAPL